MSGEEWKYGGESSWENDRLASGEQVDIKYWLCETISI